ncbi:hypothetical protein BKP44_17840 [Formosa algae]|nr:hypothetical protein BKP44_17840 [Formosa algae]
MFPTLFHEGHPLALTEALKSGCYCLVSDIEPLPEIMKYGEYGVMVDFPNNPSSWLKVMNKTYVSYNYEGNPFMLPSEVYNFDTWMCNMERVMEEELI